MGRHKRDPGFCPRFFVDEGCTAGEELDLGAEDSHHASHVLRLRPGDRCEVVTPTGGVHEAAVVSVDRVVRVLVGEMKAGEAAGAAYARSVGIVQALARPSAMDYAIEKGTEVGASFFVIVVAAGSPEQAGRDMSVRMDRWRRIAREAAKQSKQTAVPAVGSLAVDAALAELAQRGTKSIVLDPGAEAPLQEVVRAGEGSGVALWVGPEGGWTPEEVAHLLQAGAEAARMGQAVLRTETAGPIAVAVSRLALGDW